VPDLLRVANFLCDCSHYDGLRGNIDDAKGEIAPAVRWR
jgi:hypothetical protein